MANLGALLHCCSGLVYFDAGLLYFGAGLLYFDPGLAALKHELVDFVVPLQIWGVCPFTSKTLGRYIDSVYDHLEITFHEEDLEPRCVRKTF